MFTAPDGHYLNVTVPLPDDGAWRFWFQDLAFHALGLKSRLPHILDPFSVRSGESPHKKPCKIKDRRRIAHPQERMMQASAIVEITGPNAAAADLARVGACVG